MAIARQLSFSPPVAQTLFLSGKRPNKGPLLVIDGRYCPLLACHYGHAFTFRSFIAGIYLHTILHMARASEFIEAKRPSLDDMKPSLSILLIGVQQVA